MANHHLERALFVRGRAPLRQEHAIEKHVSRCAPQNAGPGTQITVRGSGFDSTVTAKVGGIVAIVSVSDENTLTLTIPSANAG